MGHMGIKLIVQIPCLNEEETLPSVLHSIPKHIPGVETIETLIIDDGSTDKTVEVAKQHGVNHIISHTQNQGLAQSFKDGIHASLAAGADIIVNTDGDNQYPQEDIGRLIQPILNNTHDIVIGDRQTDTIKHFSPLKKFLQRFGTRIVQIAAQTNVQDAPSGFRAYSREAAISITLVTDFSYTLETLIQAGQRKLAITHVPIKTNPKTRESRLFKSMSEHVFKSMRTILRVYTMYQPFKIFLTGGIILFIIGTIPFFRVAYLMLRYQELISGHLQSLIVGTVLMIIGFLVIIIGIISDLLAINRKLLEETLRKVKELEYEHLNKHVDGTPRE